jgi:hypothetical protein
MDYRPFSEESCIKNQGIAPTIDVWRGREGEGIFTVMEKAAKTPS